MQSFIALTYPERTVLVTDIVPVVLLFDGGYLLLCGTQADCFFRCPNQIVATIAKEACQFLADHGMLASGWVDGVHFLVGLSPEHAIKVCKIGKIACGDGFPIVFLNLVLVQGTSVYTLSSTQVNIVFQQDQVAGVEPQVVCVAQDFFLQIQFNVTKSGTQIGHMSFCMDGIDVFVGNGLFFQVGQIMNAAVVVQQVYAAVGVHQYQRVGLLVVIHAGDVHAVEVFQTVESPYACVFCIIGQKVVSAKRIHHISSHHVLGGIPIGWVYVPFANLLGGRLPGEKQNQNRKDVFAEDRHDVSTF